jgi:hypothetical protein
MNKISTVRLTGIKAGESSEGQNARRIEMGLSNGSTPVQPTSSGNLIKNRYSLETVTRMAGNQCCDKPPTASIEANIYNRPIQRT